MVAYLCAAPFRRPPPPPDPTPSTVHRVAVAAQDIHEMYGLKGMSRDGVNLEYRLRGGGDSSSDDEVEVKTGGGCYIPGLCACGTPVEKSKKAFKDL